MIYYLLMYGNEKVPETLPKHEIDKVLGEIQAWGQSLEKAGVLAKGSSFLHGHLHPTSAAATVRVQGGKTVVTHGPFAETREQLGGFCAIDCKNLDEALEWAAKAPQAQFGSVEVRPSWDGMDLKAYAETARKQGLLKS